MTTVRIYKFRDLNHGVQGHPRALALVLGMFYCSRMTDHRPRPALRLVEGRKPSVLDDRRVVLDFTRVCKIVGIMDSETGLISHPPRERPVPGE
jgi:hypothetical protein